MTLRDKLRQIYTSGNSYTVLQLLKELIDTIDEFDTGLPMYKHTVSFDDGDQHLVVYSYSKEAVTDLDGLQTLIATGINAKCDDKTVLNFTKTDEQIRVRYFYQQDLSYSDVTDFTDTVTLME